jgi:hypothetical protein
MGAALRLDVLVLGGGPPRPGAHLGGSATPSLGSTQAGQLLVVAVEGVGDEGVVPRQAVARVARVGEALAHRLAVLEAPHLDHLLLALAFVILELDLEGQIRQSAGTRDTQSLTILRRFER